MEDRRGTTRRETSDNLNCAFLVCLDSPTHKILHLSLSLSLSLSLPSFSKQQVLGRNWRHYKGTTKLVGNVNIKSIFQWILRSAKFFFSLRDQSPIQLSSFGKEKLSPFAYYVNQDKACIVLSRITQPTNSEVVFNHIFFTRQSSVQYTDMGTYMYMCMCMCMCMCTQPHIYYMVPSWGQAAANPSTCFHSHRSWNRTLLAHLPSSHESSLSWELKNSNSSYAEGTAATQRGNSSRGMVSNSSVTITVRQFCSKMASREKFNSCIEGREQNTHTMDQVTHRHCLAVGCGCTCNVRLAMCMG